MDFTLSPEQLLIRDSVAGVASSCAPGQHWAKFAELGFLAVGAPDDAGGFGGPVETLLLMEQLGRAGAVTPYLAQVVFAGGVLEAADRRDLLARLVTGDERFAVAYDEAQAVGDPRRTGAHAAREGDLYVLRGRKTRVLDATTADTLLVAARTADELSLFAVPADAPGITIVPYPAEDGADVADVVLDGVRAGTAALAGARGDGERILDEALDRAVAALCAEGLGLIGAMLEMTVDYTKQRRQFGVAIASFQALQHRMVEMYLQLELARSMAYRAAMVLESEPDAAQRRRGVSAAKVQVATSGRFVGQNAIQLHGGIGMSEEYKLGRYFKRMTMVERLLGDRSYHLARYREAAGARREAAAV